MSEACQQTPNDTKKGKRKMETNGYAPVRPVSGIGVEVFTTGQIGRLCHVAPRTVSKWFDSGKLRGYRIPGSDDRRVLRADLLRFLRENGLPCTALESQTLLAGVEPGLAAKLGGESVPTPFDLGRAVDAAFGQHRVVVDAASWGAGISREVGKRLRTILPQALLIVLLPDDEPESDAWRVCGFDVWMRATGCEVRLAGLLEDRR
jgi:two-component system, OmpR family, response regulator RpaA